MARFNWREDDKYTIERLCEEENLPYTKEAKFYVINNAISVAMRSYTVCDLINGEFKNCDCKENVFFVCKNILSSHLKPV